MLHLVMKGIGKLVIGFSIFIFILWLLSGGGGHPMQKDNSVKKNKAHQSSSINLDRGT